MWSFARPPRGGLRLAPAFLTLLILTPALAAPDSRRTTAPTTCDLETVASGTVASITDGRTFVLDDGREVRLPAVEIPALPAPPASPAPTDSAASTPTDPPQPPCGPSSRAGASPCALQNSSPTVTAGSSPMRSRRATATPVRRRKPCCLKALPS